MSPFPGFNLSLPGNCNPLQIPANSDSVICCCVHHLICHNCINTARTIGTGDAGRYGRIRNGENGVIIFEFFEDLTAGGDGGGDGGIPGWEVKGVGGDVVINSGFDGEGSGEEGGEGEEGRVDGCEQVEEGGSEMLGLGVGEGEITEFGWKWEG